jgi:acetyl esterase/lipase
MLFTLPIVTPLVTAAAITKFHLSGEDLSKYDINQSVTFDTDPNGPGHEDVRIYLRENFIKPAQEGSKKERLREKRARFERTGLSREFPCTFQPVRDMLGDTVIDGEWVLTPKTDPNRRLLYIHGGGNTVGSAVSHRAITSNIATRTGAAVFSMNYRLMPENARLDGVEDTRAAYRWVLHNGPKGKADAEKVAIAGDSAGGNLTLSLVNWIKEQTLQRPDAVVALSPAIDTTCSSPSIKKNFETDLMLKPLAGPLVKIPRPVLLWVLWRTNRITPASPVVSPIFADLSDLPPTLIHVSAAEMLYDDARRYAAKATAQGSDVTLQSWAHVCHVWHAFDQMLPEAGHAFDEIATFLKKHGVAR